MTNTLRQRIETAIEGLVSLLDEIDGDPHLEDNGDYEPYLSAGARNWTTAGHDPLRMDCERDDAETGM